MGSMNWAAPPFGYASAAAIDRWGPYRRTVTLGNRNNHVFSRHNTRKMRYIYPPYSAYVKRKPFRLG